MMNILQANKVISLVICKNIVQPYIIQVFRQFLTGFPVYLQHNSTMYKLKSIWQQPKEGLLERSLTSSSLPFFPFPPNKQTGKDFWYMDKTLHCWFFNTGMHCCWIDALRVATKGFLKRFLAWIGKIYGLEERHRDSEVFLTQILGLHDVICRVLILDKLLGFLVNLTWRLKILQYHSPSIIDQLPRKVHKNLKCEQSHRWI